MSTQTRPVTILVIPDSIDGLIDLFQDVYVKAAAALNDIDAYRTFLDAVYLESAEEGLEDLGTIARLAQSGLMMMQHGKEERS